jgi:hypothetical protein
MATFLRQLRLVLPKTNKVTTNMCIGAGMCVGHATYAYSTYTEEEIEVKKTMKLTRSGWTNFHVFDTNGNCYKIPYSFWYLRFNVPEVYASIKPGDKIMTGVYGYRIPFLDVFRCMVPITPYLRSAEPNSAEH